MIVDFNNNFINEAVLEEEEYIPYGFIPEREDNMEFIKTGNKFLIKDSNGVIVDEKQKLQLEKNELIIEDVKSNNCQQETTKKIKKIKKQVKEIEEKEEPKEEPVVIEDNATIKETV